MVVIQRALRAAFDAGETLARIGPQCAVAVVSRAEPALSYVARPAAQPNSRRPASRDRIRRNRMWLERLPRERDSLPALIRQLND